MKIREPTVIPKGAYYVNYYREPGKTDNNWFVADSGAIGMGVLATAVRTRYRDG